MANAQKALSKVAPKQIAAAQDQLHQTSGGYADNIRELATILPNMDPDLMQPNQWANWSVRTKTSNANDVAWRTTLTAELGNGTHHTDLTISGGKGIPMRWSCEPATSKLCPTSWKTDSDTGR